MSDLSDRLQQLQTDALAELSSAGDVAEVEALRKDAEAEAGRVPWFSPMVTAFSRPPRQSSASPGRTKSR